MNKKIIGMDPGMTRTGVAWIAEKKVLAFGVEPKSGDICAAAKEILYQLSNAVPGGWTILMEYPTPRSGPGGAGVRPEVLTLGIFVGYLTALLVVEGFEVEWITPNKWKGSVPKDVTKLRVRRRWPELPEDLAEDVYDALGILAWGLDR